MPNTKALNAFFALVIIVVGGAAASLFTVDAREQAIVLRFGQPVAVYSAPGLKAKLPWPIETVRYFDMRILDLDPAAERVNLASDEASSSADDDTDTTKKIVTKGGSIPIMVDTFARWRIVDPVRFLQRMGTEANARTRLESTMNTATRDVLGKATLGQLLSPQRAALMQLIRTRVNADMKPRGVDIVDIRIGRADLTEQLRDSTVNRMITERREEATQARAKGKEKAQEIRSTADKERTILLANARRDAETMRGEGDRAAIEITTKAANADPAFYAFLKTMFAYQDTLASPDTNLILSPDSAFLGYLKSPQGK